MEAPSVPPSVCPVLGSDSTPEYPLSPELSPGGAGFRDVIARENDAGRKLCDRLRAAALSDEGDRDRDTGEHPSAHSANDQEGSFQEGEECESFEEGFAQEDVSPILDEDPAVAARRSREYDLAVRTRVAFLLARIIDVHILRASRRNRWSDAWKQRFSWWWHRLLFHPACRSQLTAPREGGWINESDTDRPLIRPDVAPDPLRVRDLLLWAFHDARHADPRRRFVGARFKRVQTPPPISSVTEASPASSAAKSKKADPVATWLTDDARSVLECIRRADPSGQRTLQLLWNAMPKRDQVKARFDIALQRAEEERATRATFTDSEPTP